MKKIEIIIPHERIDNANRILNEFGIRDEMSFYQTFLTDHIYC